MTKFYAFVNRFTEVIDDSYMVVYTDDIRQGNAPLCPVCNGIIGLLPTLPPVRAELELFGHHFGDVAPSGHQLLVSARLRDLFVASQMIGLYELHPTEIIHVRKHKRKLHNECPLYFLASVARSRAAIDMKASRFEWKVEPTCTECRKGRLIKRWSCITIEPGTWSGEDIFYPRGFSVLLVTERFREMYTANGLRNGVFIPAEEFGHDYYPEEKEAPSDAN